MKNRRVLNKSVFILLAISLFAIHYAQSQDTSTANPEKNTPANNPPVRGVRLSDVEGSVQLSDGDKVLTDAATANITLYEGSRITAINDGRAEVQLDDGSLIRLTPSSTLTLTLLRQEGNQTETELELNNGLAYFELRAKHENSGMRVKFGDAFLTTTLDCVVRINFDQAPGTVSVLSGEVHVERPSGLSVDVHGGENLDLDARDATHYNLTEQIQPDSWDGWNKDRDLALSGAASQQTPASQSMANGSAPAWNDLDANGNWYNVPDVGPVWSPSDAAYSGWDPYGSGYWMWYPTYGYSWVSSEPWGYLPYRCGMWNYYDSFGWGWAPGFGGCNPWYVGGFWYGNWRYGPPGWRYPHRPGHPIGIHGMAPRIAVNHNVTGGKLIRPTNGPVTIAGHSVTPMRPVATRGTYASGSTGVVSRGSYNSTGGVTRPNPSSSHAGTPAHPASGSRPASSAGHASSGGSVSHASSGGGGGGGHSGGGGGGGGGHH